MPQLGTEQLGAYQLGEPNPISISLPVELVSTTQNGITVTTSTTITPPVESVTVTENDATITTSSTLSFTADSADSTENSIDVSTTTKLSQKVETVTITKITQGQLGENKLGTKQLGAVPEQTFEPTLTTSTDITPDVEVITEESPNPTLTASAIISFAVSSINVDGQSIDVKKELRSIITLASSVTDKIVLDSSIINSIQLKSATVTETEQDFDLVQGDDKTLDFSPLTDADGNKVDINNYEIEWKLYELGTENAVITKSVSGGGVTIRNATEGKYEVDLDPADTEDLASVYQHEVEITDTNNSVSTVSKGTVRIEEDAK